MKKLLKKMAYDREKYEKQDKNTNDVRETCRYVFMQMSVLFLLSHAPEGLSYVSVLAGPSTHLLGPVAMDEF